MSQLPKCCGEVPPAKAGPYDNKGIYQEVAGTKTYVSGNPSTAKRALVYVYDAFGYSTQCCQANDILADAMPDTVVLQPDLLGGPDGYLSLSVVPPDTPEKQKAMGEWFTSAGDFGKRVPEMQEYVTKAKAAYPHITSWGAFGLCWGGKIVALNSVQGTPFTASGQTHPGRPTAEDAKNMTIPHLILFSKEDCSEEVRKEFTEILQAKNNGSVADHYPTMHHGWMGARADLSNEDNAKQWVHGHNATAKFFTEHLTI